MGVMRFPSGDQLEFSDRLSLSLVGDDGRLLVLVDSKDPRRSAWFLHHDSRTLPMHIGWGRTRYMTLRLADAIDGRYDGPVPIANPFTEEATPEPQFGLGDNLIDASDAVRLTWMATTQRVMQGSFGWHGDNPISITAGSHASQWKEALTTLGASVPVSTLASLNDTRIEIDTTRPADPAFWAYRGGMRTWLGWADGDEVAPRLNRSLEDPFPQFTLPGIWLEADWRPVRLLSSAWACASRAAEDGWGMHFVPWRKDPFTIVADAAILDDWHRVLGSLDART